MFWKRIPGRWLVFRTLIGNSEVWSEVHALQSGSDGAPVTQILNSTRRGRSNQWRSSCRMLVNPPSNFRVLVITRAAALRTLEARLSRLTARWRADRCNSRSFRQREGVDFGSFDEWWRRYPKRWGWWSRQCLTFLACNLKTVGRSNRGCN